MHLHALDFSMEQKHGTTDDPRLSPNRIWQIDDPRLGRNEVWQTDYPRESPNRIWQAENPKLTLSLISALIL